MADEQLNRVEVTGIRWPRGIYPKQTSEEQKDTFGGYLREVVLVSGTGKSQKRVVIQRDGKPVEGALPTIQRQFVKLLLAIYHTMGSKKGNGYTDALGLNLEANQGWYRNMVDGGWSVEAHYGSNPDSAAPFFASAGDLLGLGLAALNIRNSTVERFPLPEEAKKAAAVVPVFEEVSLTF